MAKRRVNKKNFLEILEILANEELKDWTRVEIAKKEFLLKKKEDMFKVAEAGYPARLIAQALTEEFLSTGIQKVVTWTNTKGEEKETEVKFSPAEIKNFLEPAS